MRKYQVRFGGRPTEKGSQDYLAGGLPNFLTLGDEAHERDLEGGLVAHVQKFLVELGAGFAFVGRQVHLKVGDTDMYIDLLFYHLRLRCFVIIDLKMKGFAAGDAGENRDGI